jgi:hypothetical protein
MVLQRIESIQLPDLRREADGLPPAKDFEDRNAKLADAQFVLWAES